MAPGTPHGSEISGAEFCSDRLIDICTRWLPSSPSEWAQVADVYNKGCAHFNYSPQTADKLINHFAVVRGFLSGTKLGQRAKALEGKGLVWDFPRQRKREHQDALDLNEDYKENQVKRLKKFFSAESDATPEPPSGPCQQNQLVATRKRPVTPRPVTPRPATPDIASSRPATPPYTTVEKTAPTQLVKACDHVSIIEALKKKLKRAEGRIDILEERNEKLHERNEKLHERVESMHAKMQRMKDKGNVIDEDGDDEH